MSVELDGGELKEKPVEVRQLVDGLTDILNEKTTNKFQYKLLTAFESIWLRVTEVNITSMSITHFTPIPINIRTHTPEQKKDFPNQCENTAKPSFNKSSCKTVLARNN